MSELKITERNKCFTVLQCMAMLYVVFGHNQVDIATWGVVSV